MQNFLKKVLFSLAVFMLLGACPGQGQDNQTLLYLFYDGKRAGEKNQVLGIANALKKDLPDDTVQKEFEPKDKETFLGDIRHNLTEAPHNKGIIIAAEADSIDVLTEIKRLNPHPNMVISHSSHQYTKNHAKLKDVANIVALPQYVVTDEILKEIESSHTKLIQTAGVPHNVSLNDIQEAYKNNLSLIPVAANYLGVILGGDAETPNHEWRYYTAAEAQKLADYLALQVKDRNAHLLILNGPRTGKHNPLTGEVIATSHRDGNGDAVTTAFVEALKNKGLIPAENFTLLDFQFGKPSAYSIVLGVLHATKSPIFVAGESTSMVSETADCLPGLVTAFHNGAMNQNHINHCASEQKSGRINILKNNNGNWELLEAAAVNDPKMNQPASHIIAGAIISAFK
jgi:hypothetical protein